MQQTRPSRLREVPLLICEVASRPPKAKKHKTLEVQGRGKAVVDMAPEPEEDRADEEEYVEVALPEGEGEPSEPVDDPVWNKNFVDKKAWIHWKSLKGKQVNPVLFDIEF